MTTVSPSRTRLPIGRSIAWLYMGIVILITVFPFYWILRTALSSNTQLTTHPSSLLPVGLSFGGFERALGLVSGAAAVAQGGSGTAVNTPLFLRNSLIYSSVLTVLVVVCSAMAAYAFARLQWRGRNFMFSLLLTALMVPSVLTLLPNFVLIKDLGLTNTFAGMILPGAFFSAFNMFFLRQFMLGLSREVEEAALIDGAGPVKVFIRIILPMTAAPMATLSLLTFINTWNDYFWPLLVDNDDSVRPLTLGLAIFKQSSPQAAVDWSGLMSATLVAAFPMLLLFMIFGKRIVNSIGFTGIK